MFDFRKIAMAALCGFGLGAAATPVLAQDRVTVAVNTLPSALYMPLYAADAMGEYEKNGIDMEIIKLKDGPTALAAAVTGGANFYMGSTGSIISAAERGTGAVVVATTQVGYPVHLVMRREVFKEKGIADDWSIDEKLKALKGLTIGVPGPGGGNIQLARYLFERVGLDPERDVSLAFVGSSNSMVAALQAKNVDVIIASNPTGDMAVADAESVWLIKGTENGGWPGLEKFPFMSLTTTEGWAKDNADVVKRFLAAVQTGSAAISGDEETSNKVRDLIYEKYFKGTERETYNGFWPLVRMTFPQSIASSSESMADVIAFLKEFSSENVSIAPEDVFTNDYVPAASTN